MVPVLRHADADLFHVVGIRDGKAFAGRAGDNRRVIGYRVLGDRVDDLSAAHVLVQVVKRACPAVGCIEYQRRAGRYTVSQQVHCDAGRIIRARLCAMVPGLRHVDADLFHGIGIGEDQPAGRIRRRCRQRAVAVIGDIHGDFIAVVIARHTDDARRFFGDRIGVRSDIRLGVLDRGETDITKDVGAGRDDIIAFFDCEAEDIGQTQLASGQ